MATDLTSSYSKTDLIDRCTVSVSRLLIVVIHDSWDTLWYLMDELVSLMTACRRRSPRTITIRAGESEGGRRTPEMTTAYRAVRCDADFGNLVAQIGARRTVSFSDTFTKRIV